LVVLLVSGCGGHIQLTAPPANASAAERAAAYDALRPINYQTDSNEGSSTNVGLLELNNGTKVKEPEDILVLLPADSRSAYSIRDAQSHAKKGQYWNIAGTAALSAGSFLALMGLAKGSKLAGFGGLGIVVGGGICLTFSKRERDEKSAATTRAYEQYDEGLRRRLGMCEQEGRVVPCR
jgi:hypothetical protein